MKQHLVIILSCLVLLRLSCLAEAAPPLNDNFANALVISGSHGKTEGSNIDATMESGEPDHVSPGGSSVWWQWTAPTTSKFTIDTFGSDFDTLLAAYTGSSVDRLSPVASNDDDETGGSGTQSRIIFSAVAGTTYRIAVDGYEGVEGSIILNWIRPDPPVNDNFANALVISGSHGKTEGSNIYATMESGEPDHAGPGGSSVWWQWTAPTTGEITIDTFGSDFDTLLAAYTGSSVDRLSPVASNDDDETGGSGTQSRIIFSAVAGTTYRIAVDAYEGVGGHIVLRLSSNNVTQPILMLLLNSP